MTDKNSNTHAQASKTDNVADTVVFNVEDDVITPLTQARATAKMLVSQREGGFSINHDEVINMIWGVEASINNALEHLYDFGDMALNMKLNADKLRAELLKTESGSSD